MCIGVNISPTCIAELEAFKIDRATNINKDVPLGAMRPCMSMLNRALHLCRSVKACHVGHRVDCHQSLCCVCHSAGLLSGCEAILQEARQEPRRGVVMPQVC